MRFDTTEIVLRVMLAAIVVLGILFFFIVTPHYWDLGRLTQQQSTLRHVTEDLEEKLSEVELEVATKESNLDILNVTLSKKQAELDLIENQLSSKHNIQFRLRDFEANQEKVTVYADSLSILESQIRSLNSERTKITTDIGLLEDRVSKQSEELVTVKAEIASDSTTNEELKSKMEELLSLEKKVSELESSSRQLIDDVNGYTNRLNLLNTSISAKSNELQEVENQMSETTVSLAVMNEQKTALENSISKLRGEEDELSQAVGSLSNEKRSLKTEIGSLKKEISLVDSVLATTKTEVVGSKKRKGVLDNTYAVLTDEISELDARRQELIRELRGYDETRLSLVMEIDSLKTIKRQIGE